MKRRWKLMLALASLGAVATGAIVLGRSAGPEDPHDAPKDTPPRFVRVQEVREGDAAVESSFTGVIRARYESNQGFRVAGKIASRSVEVGQRVQAGDVLFQLDLEDYELAVSAAEADLVAAEAEVKQSAFELDRTKRLRETGAVSVSGLDQALADRDVAVGRRDRAVKELALARNRLDYGTLRADADGIVTALSAEKGQVVAAGETVARLARRGEKEAVVSLPENRIAEARTAEARVTLWAAPGRSFSATLRELSPTADPITRTYLARYSVECGESGVELGMTATVHLKSASAASGYLLPLSSLHRQGDQTAVWVVQREPAPPRLTPVVVQAFRQDAVVVSGGVKPGDLVVTAGVQKLDPRVAVRPWEDKR
ncbi:MAG TPA: efflux RND transporter periplasmic adaptor subunit [Pirellulales bacterium]